MSKLWQVFKIFKLIKFFISKLTLKKILNAFCVYFSYLISLIIRKPIRYCFPISISIEPTNYCNLRCPECPVGNNTLKRKKGYFKFTDFQKIIEQSSDFLLNLFLYFQGEPFLNKEIFKMIEFATQKGIFTSISTNGHFFSDKNIKQIINSKLDYLIISIDGTTQQIYEKYRIGGNLNQVLEGTKKLIEAKNKTKNQKPFIELQFLVLKTNEHQIKDFKKLANKLGADKVSFKSAQIYFNFNKFVPKNEKYSRYRKLQNKWVIKRKINNRCWRLWNSVVITWEGDILPCCYDKNGQYKFGNIKEGKIKEIIKNEKFKRFAKTVLTNQKSIDICRNCWK